VLVRQHRLTVELRRIDDLRRETDLVRELGEVSFEEGDDAVAKDLTQTYAQLLRKLKRAERELVDFRETGQADAILVVRPAGSTGRAADWAKELCAMYAAWAKERQFDVELEEKAERHVLRVLGAYAYGYLRGESGAHRLIRPPEKRDDRRGEATLARVMVKPLPQGSTADVRREDDEAPIRTYDLWRSYGVRDRRTGYVEGDVRKVLAGRIDPFLDAYADFVAAAGDVPAAS
jgi:peptide chain release factor 2